MRILVIEDDRKISRFVCEGLEAEGHHVDAAFDGLTGRDMALGRSYDLILLDLLLPGLSGAEVLASVRKVDSMTIVIVLTALADVSDRVQMLEGGADDYLTKPFSFLELRARIRSNFRRSSRAPERQLRFGGLELDPILRRVSFHGDEVELSAREFRLLEFLAQTPGEPVTRAMIADRVWGYQFDTGTNVIEVYVNYLRKKLGRLGVKPIRTLRGIGYMLDPDACHVEEPES